MVSLKSKEYLEFADRYPLDEENPKLYEMALKNNGDARQAADILTRNASGMAMVKATISNRQKETEAIALLSAMRGVGGKNQLDLISSTALNKNRSANLRKNAFEFLGGSGGGEDLVLSLLKDNKIEKQFIPSAVQGVSRSWRRSVRSEATSYLGTSKASAGQQLPAIPALVAMKGNSANGIKMFAQNCSICHQINGEGMDVGPKLSEIGSKLSKDGQYLAILHPDAGIGFGYETWELKMKDGSTRTGIIASKTEMEIVLKMPGGVIQNIKTKDMASLKQLPNSMMPTGLQENMSTQELVDLVEYLASLKRKG